MTAIVTWYETIVGSIPLPLLEVWGRFCLYRRPLPGFLRLRRLHVPDRRALGIRPGAAEVGTKAFLSIPLTFVLIIATGYIGSFIVLGPGRTDVRVLEGSGRSAERRPSGLPGAHHHSVRIRVVGLD